MLSAASKNNNSRHSHSSVISNFCRASCEHKPIYTLGIFPIQHLSRGVTIDVAYAIIKQAIWVFAVLAGEHWFESMHRSVAGSTAWNHIKIYLPHIPAVELIK